MADKAPLVVGFAGHRPHKLPNKETGYAYNNPLRNVVRTKITSILDCLHDYDHNLVVLTGMNLGPEQEAAVWCRNNQVRYVCAIPSLDWAEGSRWQEQSLAVYAELMSHAWGVYNASSDGPPFRPVRASDSADSYKKARGAYVAYGRSQFVGLRCDLMVGVWYGLAHKLGRVGYTNKSMETADDAGKPTLIVDPGNDCEVLSRAGFDANCVVHGDRRDGGVDSLTYHGKLTAYPTLVEMVELGGSRASNSPSSQPKKRRVKTFSERLATTRKDNDDSNKPKFKF